MALYEIPIARSNIVFSYIVWADWNEAQTMKFQK